MNHNLFVQSSLVMKLVSFQFGNSVNKDNKCSCIHILVCRSVHFCGRIYQTIGSWAKPIFNFTR